MKISTLRCLCALSLCAGSINLVDAQSLNALSMYSVITPGDFVSNTDITGRALIGGNLSGSPSLNFATSLQGVVPSSGIVLRVGGNIEFGNPIQVNAGSIELGGSIESGQNGQRQINFNGGGSVISNPGVSYDDIFTELSLASVTLSELPANSAVTLPGSQPSAVVFNSTPDTSGVSVFSLTAAEIFSNSSAQQFELIANSGDDIVINISGTNVDWTNSNFVGLFTDDSFAERIIWNFFEADTIDFGGRAFYGQILAPGAEIVTSGSINGSVFADEINTSAIIDLPTYAGGVSVLSVPEPSSCSFLIITLLGVSLKRKR